MKGMQKKWCVVVGKREGERKQSDTYIGKRVGLICKEEEMYRKDRKRCMGADGRREVKEEERRKEG